MTNYPNLFTPNNFTVDERNVTTSYSVYADVTVDLSEQFTIFGGVRYTHDKKEFDAIIAGDPDLFWNPATSSVIDPNTGVATVGQVVDIGDKWGEITYRAGVQFRPADNIMLYATRATGFRSGAFDAAQSDPDLARSGVDPESVVSHEIGLKSRLFDNQVQFNVALFNARYDDLQFFVGTTSSTFASNAGFARVRGAEVELVAALTPELTFSGQYVYQDGTSGDIPPAAEVADGTPPQGTIPHSFVIALDYERELSNGNTFFMGADVSHKDRYNTELEDAPQFFSQTDALLNARLGYRFNGGWEVTLWGQNLLNEDIVIYGQNTWVAFYDGPTAFSNLEVITETSQPRYDDPRTWGATIRKSF